MQPDTEPSVQSTMRLVAVILAGLSTLAAIAQPPVPAPTAATVPPKAAQTPPTRVAWLHLGPPKQKHVDENDDDAIGYAVLPKHFDKAADELEKLKADVVIIEVNCGGGDWRTASDLAKVFETKFKPRFRTAAWIRKSIGETSLAIWPIEEFVMGEDAPVTGYSGWRMCQNFRELNLEALLVRAEEVSRQSNRDPLILRAMMIFEPLSMDIVDGKRVFCETDDLARALNPKGPLQIKGGEALHLGLAKAIAHTREECLSALGIKAHETVGQPVSDQLEADRNRCAKRLREFRTLGDKRDFWLNVLRKERDASKPSFDAARNSLAELRAFVETHPETLQAERGGDSDFLNTAWFDEQERIIYALVGLKPVPR